VANRREFLHLFKKPVAQSREGSHHVVRPPYGQGESLFQSECTVCEDQRCVTGCEEGIILIGADRTPMLNFTQNGCTFCEACAKACDESGHKALNLSYPGYTTKVNAEFRIATEGCVAHHGVICFSCKEPCLEDAILFNGMFNPVIDMDLCTGCGFCLHRCPTKAISYFAIPMKEMKEEIK